MSYLQSSFCLYSRALDCFYPDLRVTYVPLCAEQNEAGCYGNRPTRWHAYYFRLCLCPYETRSEDEIIANRSPAFLNLL